MNDYVVVCLNESEEMIATHRIFTERGANTYASTIARSRKPRVMSLVDYLIDIEHWRRDDRSSHLSWGIRDVEFD